MRKKMSLTTDPVHGKGANVPHLSPSKLPDLFTSNRPGSEELLVSNRKFDELLQLLGSGKHIWADEPADDYVRNLREGW